MDGDDFSSFYACSFQISVQICWGYDVEEVEDNNRHIHNEYLEDLEYMVEHRILDKVVVADYTYTVDSMVLVARLEHNMNEHMLPNQFYLFYSNHRFQPLR